MNSEITLDQLVEQLGGSAPATEPEVEPTTTSTSEEPPAAETTPAVTEEGTLAESQQEPEVPPMDKAQQAFIRMRQQNKQYADTLKGIASLVGIEGDQSNEESILAALQSKITENEAKQNNVPVELYQRLKQLEERDAEYTNLQRQQEVAAGFEAVKNQFGLNQDELNGFAEALVKSGKNPLDGGMDLVSAYKIMNYDNLVEKAKAKAVADEQARAAKAGTQATTPANKTGQAPADSEKQINSVRDLEKWLSEQV